MSRDGTDPVDLDALDEPDGSELLGTVIADRYQLEAVLGRGGMGLVYRAAHLGLRRKVAVKVLHPSLAASGDVRHRFEREAFAAGKIDHPNCINVMDSGKLPDGTRYLAMELLDGRALGDILEREGQIDLGRALHILAHILRGLGHIHSAGLIHRDIKPENIFLIRHGADEDFAKILDFGIAKGMGKTDLDEGVKLTQAGMAFGTPIYMAPEQALGNPMDGRADLYAAAVIGYEMLTGQPPFYSDDKLEVMSMHTAKPVPPMRSRLIKGGKPVPSSIERLIAKGLTKKPNDRYANAEVFLAAVENALRTPDGGVTDVSFERPSTEELERQPTRAETRNRETRRPVAQSTGSQPLITADGRSRITGASEMPPESSGIGRIADAIDDALGAAMTSPPVIAPPPVVQPPIIGVPPKRDSAPRGGIGIGLPYTGPSGEPIFGLTQEQRLAQVGIPLNDRSLAGALEPDAATTPVVKNARKRWPLYAAIAGLAVVAGVVIAVLTVPRGGDDVVETMDPATPAGQALALYKEGKFDEAIKLLETDAVKLAADGEMQLVLGHIHSAQFQRKRALAAYRGALSKRFDLESDAELRSNLRTAAADKDLDVVREAFDLWVRTSDPEAKQLIKITAVHDEPGRRHTVEPIIDKHKLRDGVEWWRAYSLDLQQLEPCAKRKEAVAKLRALGDPRAKEPLEVAIERRSKQNPKYKVNACLIDDAKAAIGYLASRPKLP
jgi:serine/threonine protein kinase/tetratricopeptide (TPR) repeat protein